MIDTSEYHLGMEQSAYYEMDVVQQWRQEPFQIMGGNQVLENMREERDGSEEGTLETRYKAIRKDILTPPTSDVTYIGFLGRSGSGKGGAGMGFVRLLKNDLFLQEELDNMGVTLDVVPVLFPLFAEVAKLPETADRLPHLAIPANMLHGEYTQQQYRNISHLMWEHMTIHHRAVHGTPTKLVYPIESSSPTSFPIVPDYQDADTQLVAVEGNDRGNSPIYSAAVNPDSKERTFIIAVKKDEDVHEEALKYRGIEQEGEVDHLRKALYGDVKVVFTPKGGDEIDVRDFPVEDQLEVVTFMRKTMAPPQGLVRSDAELQALMQQLRFSSVTDAEFYKKLRGKLKMGKRQFSVVKNTHFQGEKTFDLNYFTDSLAARMYPQIIPECLRS